MQVITNMIGYTLHRKRACETNKEGTTGGEAQSLKNGHSWLKGQNVPTQNQID